MDLLGNELLKSRPDTVMTIRKMYNLEKPEDMDRAVDALEEWLKKQHHLTKREYPRDFLERSIILMKGSVERAKSQIDNLCSMRTIFPKFFEKFDAKNDFNHLEPHVRCALMPKLTKDHYRMYILQFIGKSITADILMDAYRFGILKSEYIKAHDYCAGFVAIFDYRYANVIEILAATDFIAVHQLVKILMEGYGMRVKGIHIISPSKVIDKFIIILKSMLGQKVSKRVYSHTNIETLYDYVSKDVLPHDLGGVEESMIALSERCKTVLGSKENVEYMKNMSKAISNEANIMRKKLNNLDLGIAGTFRSLSFD